MTLDRADVERRLLARRQIDETTECWLWPGAKLPTGHGQLRIAGACYLTHRLAAWLWLGLDIHDRYMGSRKTRSQCNHKCANASCFNPSHLYVGTQADNLNDRPADRVKRPMPAFCRRGHAQSAQTYRKGVGCLICQYERHAQWQRDYAKRTDLEIPKVCRNGHALTPETFKRPGGCRICRANSVAAYELRKQARRLQKVS